MFKNIPENWEYIKISDNDIATIIMGQSPDSMSYNNNHQGVPFYQGKTDFGEIYPTPRVWCSAPLKFAEENDILLSVRAPVGAVNYSIEKCCIGRGLAAIRAQKRTNAKYLFYFFKYYEPILKNEGNGAVFKAITKTFVENIKIPLAPTLQEQQEIVQILDTASDIIRYRKECIKNAQDLIPALFQEMFGNPITTVKYKKIKLNSIFEFKSGGTPSTKNKDFFTGNIPWITTVALTKLYIDEKHANELITEEAIKKSSTKLIPANSLLLGTRVGIGKVAINTVPMCTNQDIVALIPNVNNSINMVYLYWFFKSIKSILVSQGRGITIKGITTGLVKNIEIPLPSNSEQEAFAQKAIEIEKYIEEQTKELEKSESMFQSLLHHAFTGELTRRAYGTTI